MQITRDSQPVPIVRSTAPHQTSDGWHGSFELPPADADKPVAAPGGMAPSPHQADWLGKTCSVEFDHEGKAVTVSAARIVAMSGDRCEWEGEADD